MSFKMSLCFAQRSLRSIMYSAGAHRGFHTCAAAFQTAPAEVEPQHTHDAARQTDQVADRIAFIGAGQMAQAMMRSWINTNTSVAENIYACSNDLGAHGALRALGVHVFGDAAECSWELCNNCDVIFLSCKPQHMADVLKYVAPHVKRKHLVVSIAAGVKLATYEASFPKGTRVVRVMPNTPMLVGRGATAYCLGSHCTAADEERVQRLLGSSGVVLGVDENMMDAVTALSGSGPAFVFMLIEALADGGVLAGLPRSTALQLAAQTAAGAADMVMYASCDGSITHPGVLRDRVASPAGTTIAGIRELEARGFRSAVIEAVSAATERSKQLS